MKIVRNLVIALLLFATAPFAAAMDPERLTELMIQAGRLGLTVLLEVHSISEYQSLWSCPLFCEIESQIPWLLGVNNRDLRTFEVDLATTICVAEAAADKAIPIIGESGIAAPGDLESLRAAGVSGVLIGETFMREDNVTQAVRRLFGELDG